MSARLAIGLLSHFSTGAQSPEKLMLVAFILALTVQAAPDAATRIDQIDTCLTCHGDETLEVTLENGDTQSLFISHEVFARSVHGDKLSCVDCHTDMVEIPHETRAFSSRREISLAYYEQCKRCHFQNYAKTLDSVHDTALARGDTTAPLCVDCHGAHDVAPPNQPRTRISQTCASCHAGVSAVFARSVHGRALVDTGSADVPTCTDCHRSHDVAGPHAGNWIDRTPELCASCHADTPLMEKYGLSTLVHQTYLTDFHGVTARLRRSDRDRDQPVIARCTDCHGVHDIMKVDDPESPVIRANLVKTCQRCHADATENFPAAWLSHYEPTWERAPLVAAVTLAYKFLIPFMMGGLILQILLHVWRVVVNR